MNPINKTQARELNAHFMHSRTLALLLAFLTVLLASCDQSFDPRATLQEQMAVFSVLSTDRSIQFVRVQKNYMPKEFNPLSHVEDDFLSDAIVTIREANKVFRLRDTSIARMDTSRYTFPLKTFYVQPLVPTRGRTYEVIVQSVSQGQISALAAVPDKPVITISSEAIQNLDRPDRFSQDSKIVFITRLSAVTKGYLGRLFLYYDVLKDNEWMEERAEIPIFSADSSNYSLDIPIFPKLTVAPRSTYTGMTYRNGYYKAIINKINERYKGTRIIFKWATLVVLQADQNVFKYYSGVHGSEDPYSIRLDEPMFSTIDGALGMVGAYSLDSLVNVLPENFWGNR